MKSRIYYLGSIFSFLILAALPAKAYQLDGLWRNDRQNITIRIETTNDGFRAKRIDQGIWYRYVNRDDHHFVDRYGNYYELRFEDQIIWNEASTGKQISFSKANDRDAYRWNERDDREDGRQHYRDDRYYDRPDHNDNHRHHVWMDQWYDDHHVHIDGRWIDTYRRNELEIICFRGGLRVKRPHGGWVKYYPDQHAGCYTDDIGNTIHVLDDYTIRWTSYHGRHDRVFRKF